MVKGKMCAAAAVVLELAEKADLYARVGIDNGIDLQVELWSTRSETRAKLWVHLGELIRIELSTGYVFDESTYDDEEASASLARCIALVAAVFDGIGTVGVSRLWGESLTVPLEGGSEWRGWKTGGAKGFG